MSTAISSAPAGGQNLEDLDASRRQPSTGESANNANAGASAESKTYPCTHPGCGKSYSRPEYVTRHALSHTNPEGLSCQTCGKRYTRKDVLTRHEKSHRASSSTPGPSSKGKLKLACDQCRKAKAKCSGTEPCERCSLGKASCTFTDSRAGVSFHPYKSPTPSTSSRAEGHVNFIAPAGTSDLDMQNNEPIVSAAAEAPRAEDPWKPALQFAQADYLYNDAFGTDMQIDLNTVFGVDSNDYLHAFGEQFGDPGSGSSAPDYNTLWPAVSSFFQDDLTCVGLPLPVEQSTQAEPAKAKEPFVPHGLSSRAPSPGHPVEADTDWLTAWDPRKDDTENGTLPHARLEDVTMPANLNTEAYTRSPIPKLDESDRMGLLELLTFADFRIDTFHSLYVRLTRIPLGVLDHFLASYFSNTHTYLPWCHVPTFIPRKTTGFLIGMMLAVGAQHSPLPGAKAFSHVLGDVVHRALGNIVISNNAFTRDIQLWQACIVWSSYKACGVPKLMEYVEVFRNSFVVPLEKMHVLDGLYQLPDIVLDHNKPLQERWQAWAAWESRKRTGFAVFVTDTEHTSFFDRPGLISPSSLCYGVPCPDAVWEAATAEEWLNQVARYGYIVTAAPFAKEVLQFRDRPSELQEFTSHSGFAGVLMVRMLHNAFWYSQQAGEIPQTAREAIDGSFHRALLAIGGGANEFCTSATPTPLSPSWRAFAISYHYALISLRVPTSTLLTLAGRGTEKVAANVQAQLAEWMHLNPVLARSVALHAGQIIRLVRETTSETGAEVCTLFLSGLLLYVYANSIPEKAVDFSIHLDCASPSALEMAFVQQGGSAILGSDLILQGSASSSLVLDYVSDLLQKRRCWDLRLSFVKILQRLSGNGQQQQ